MERMRKDSEGQPENCKTQRCVLSLSLSVNCAWEGGSEKEEN